MLCNFGGFQEAYKAAHGYLSIIVCFLGIILNLLNLIVLGHKEMRSNPINLILFSIAVADILLMVDYIPFAVHMYIMEQQNSREEQLSYVWGIVLLVHVNFSLMIHTVSIWLTLSLAIWRYIMIKYHSLAQTLCTIKRCKIVLLLGFVVPAFLTIPNFLALSLLPYNEPSEIGENISITVWRLQMSNEELYNFNIWFYSFFLKLVPCIILTLVTALLVRAMVQAMKRAQRLKDMSTRAEKRALVNQNGSKPSTSTAPVARQKKTDRTTRLLITILLLFLATEFPQGILGFLAIANESFFLSCYTPLGDVMDMMALLNCSINFPLYCLMSKQFRSTFRKICNIQINQGPGRMCTNGVKSGLVKTNRTALDVTLGPTPTAGFKNIKTDDMSTPAAQGAASNNN